MIIMIIGAIVLLGLLYIYFKKYKKADKKKADKPEAKAQEGKVYGVMTCPHTVTQTKKYPGYDFVDCSIVGNCPPFVTAYPTTRHPSGEIEVGVSN